MTYGLKSFGCYVPRLRLARSEIARAHKWIAPALASAAKGERAFCNWDEDSITMAVEASRACLGSTGRDIHSLALASTTLPYADLSNSEIVASALDLDPVTPVSDRTGSQRAATTALLQTLTANAGDALVVASDQPQAKPASSQEMTYGAGAAALLLGEGDDLIARYLGGASLGANFADHVRPANQTHDYYWEERWIRDEGYAKIVPKAVSAALDDAGIMIGEVDHLILPTIIRGADKLVARQIGFVGTIADALAVRCGYTGAAHSFLMLAQVLESAKAGEKVLMVGFGQGADALLFEATGKLPDHSGWRSLSAILDDAIVTDDYLRMLSFRGEIAIDGGMRAERAGGKAILTEAYRSAGMLNAFKAGRCPSCGTIQFPQLAYCVTPGCNAPAGQFEQQSLADAPARILTVTADWLAYYPSPPLNIGFVQFENGARLLMEVVDAPQAAIEVGAELRMVFRIKERDQGRGFNRYFWKAVPDKL